MAGALVVATCAEDATSAAAAAQRTCPPAGGKAIARSARVVVYEPPPAEDVGTNYLRACDRRSRRSVTIGVDIGHPLIALRGPVVGALGTQCLDSDGLEPCAEGLIIRNVATGRQTVPRRPAACPEIDAGPYRGFSNFTCGDIELLVVGTRRTAAWTASWERMNTVVAMNARGRATVAARAPGIDLRSLRNSADGRGFTWTQDGVGMRARWP